MGFFSALAVYLILHTFTIFLIGCSWRRCRRRLWRRRRHLDRFSRSQRRDGVLIDDAVDAGDDVEGAVDVQKCVALAKWYSDVAELKKISEKT